MTKFISGGSHQARLSTQAISQTDSSFSETGKLRRFFFTLPRLRGNNQEVPLVTLHLHPSEHFQVISNRCSLASREHPCPNEVL